MKKFFGFVTLIVGLIMGIKGIMILTEPFTKEGIGWVLVVVGAILLITGFKVMKS